MQARPDESPESLQWWQKTIVYQIYPRSFQDSSGNGVGDIPGIISRLDHFTYLGVGAIWLSPFYPSPQLDFGYDISDFCDVDPLFGTLQDFDNLVKECHDRDIKVIVDFVPGHSSHLHPWFQKSVRREEPYTDYYVWHDGKTGDNGERLPPNNWLSVFGGSSWAWNEERGQFYFRPFLPEQPKLNYRNPRVVEEMKNVLRFWMSRGVDGVRVDAVSEIMESADKSQDEPCNMKGDYPQDQYEYLNHIHTSMHPEGFPLIRGWRDVMDEYEKKDGKSRFMVIEIYAPAKSRNVYREFGGNPFNMDLVDLERSGLSGQSLKSLIEEEYSNIGGGWPTFVLGNHDRNRLTFRFGREFADVLNMLLLTLKGTPTTYYGEELAMSNIEVSFEDTQDPFGKNMGPERYELFSRDPCRSPMQWDNTRHAGFTKSDHPWLPVHPDYANCNVKTQTKSDGSSTSLTLYKALATLRQKPAFLCGGIEFAICNKEVFSYIREDKTSGERYLVALNVGKVPALSDFSGSPVNATVEICTCSASKRLTTGQTVSLQGLTLNPGDGVVLKL
ncbi:alpha-glucosidase [Aplysia californica]|uniref:Alpha-glucosidase n=1 Tax=Aplysia californica TaxID=6500 RepID=A0ABM0JGH9_APLCA|nr:alpha-glucosidase [Aplysia californica]